MYVNWKSNTIPGKKYGKPISGRENLRKRKFVSMYDKKVLKLLKNNFFFIHYRFCKKAMSSNGEENEYIISSWLGLDTI